MSLNIDEGELKTDLIIGTVIADIAAHLPQDTLSGIIYLDGLPYIGTDIMVAMGTPHILELIPKLFDETCSSSASRQHNLDFIDSCFAKYDHKLKVRVDGREGSLQSVSSRISGEKARLNAASSHQQQSSDPLWELRCSWLGMGMQQTCAHRRFVLTRTQDPAPLCALGATGMPTLVLCGKYDAHLDGEILAQELRNRSFTNLELRLIEKGGSHSVHIENMDEVMSCVLRFAKSAMKTVRNFAAVVV